MSMIFTKRPRILVPAVMAIGGTAIAVGLWIGNGWRAALGVELLTVVAACGYLVLGGRDTDFGAMIASKPDERQASIGMRAAALSGVTLCIAALGGVVIATAMGRLVWPFLLFSVVGSTAYLMGLVIYRDR
jgi:hypothetical protein